MPKRNIFEMLGLEFDPPDNVKKIRAAHDAWKKRLTAEQNTTVDPVRLNQIREELSMDEYISLTIDNPRFRQHEAESLKQQRVEELRLYIDIERGDTGGTLQVNQTQLRQVREKLKLSLPTIEATYREQGFDIKPAKTAQKILSLLNNFFTADSVLEELSKNFAAFQKVPDEKNFPWSATVKDLYDLAYHIDGEIEPSPDFYRRRSTDDLREIFRDAAKKFSAPIPQWQAIKALLNLAQTQIFNSDDNRFKYDHSLKIATLAEFFAKLKIAPELFKRDNFFADNCIARIRRTFPNFLTYELSVALYNKVAGLLKNPYESTGAEENFFCVTCANCGAFENFRTHEDAQKSRCKICGENFFVECPKCGKKIPATSEHCTNCGFSFAELKNFSAYVAEANSMLDLVEQARNSDESVNIVTAEIVKLLARAKILKPESNDIKKIEWRINKVAAEIKRRELYAWAEKKLPSLSIAPAKAVSDCVEILRKIKDYKPAVDRLRLIVPKSPKVLTATPKENYSSTPAITSKISVKAKSAGIVNSDLICHVAWQAPDDLAVTYTLVRKVGGVPKTFRDGEILIENTDRTEFVDSSIKPGVLYGYGIFSARLGNFSSPTTTTAIHYSDLDEKKLIAKTENGACKFIWRLPAESCIGVRILRSDSAGKSVVVADCVQSTAFVDKAVKNREQYQYRLQCVYIAAEDNLTNDEKFFSRQSTDEALNGVWKIERTYKYSHGLTVNLTPEQPPKSLENLSCVVRNGRAHFSWQSTGDFTIWFKEFIRTDGEKISPQKLFELDKIDELLGSGVVCKRAESLDESCDFPLSGDTVKIAVVSTTKEFGLLNEIFTCANVEPCEIDAAKTQIDAGGLKLVLKSVPANLYLIHYKINTADADELYATVDTAKARQMNRIYATKYAQDTFIGQTHLPPKEIFITVIGEYKFSDGSAAYSEPSTLILDNRPKEIISYRLEWGTTGFINKTVHAKDCKLIIESDAKSTPKMFLVCRRDGRLNIELGDSATRTLGTVRAYDDGYSGGRLEINLPNDTWKDIAQGTVIKLLASKEDEARFELQASRPESLVVPKK